MTDREQAVAAQFAHDTATHRLHVLHNAPVYRHLRFKRPQTGLDYFDLITWPGHLAIGGDRETYVFARLDDMFQFFRGQRINPLYWSEKAVHVGGRRACKEYSEDHFNQLVAEHLDEAEADWPGIKAAWIAHLNDYADVTGFESGAREALDSFRYHLAADQVVVPLPGDSKPAGPPRTRTFEFSDTWEWDLTEWDWHFLWSLHAIVWGIQQYDAAVAVTA